MPCQLQELLCFFEGEWEIAPIMIVSQGMIAIHQCLQRTYVNLHLCTYPKSSAIDKCLAQREKWLTIVDGRERSSYLLTSAKTWQKLYQQFDLAYVRYFFSELSASWHMAVPSERDIGANEVPEL